MKTLVAQMSQTDWQLEGAWAQLVMYAGLESWVEWESVLQMLYLGFLKNFRLGASAVALMVPLIGLQAWLSRRWFAGSLLVIFVLAQGSC